MKRKVKYTNEPMGKLRVVDDFLPAPEELVFKEDNVKITMALGKIQRGILQGRGEKASYFLSGNDPSVG